MWENLIKLGDDGFMETYKAEIYEYIAFASTNGLFSKGIFFIWEYVFTSNAYVIDIQKNGMLLPGNST